MRARPLITSSTLFEVGMLLDFARGTLFEVVFLLEVEGQLDPLWVVDGANVALVFELEVDLFEVPLKVFFPL